MCLWGVGSGGQARGEREGKKCKRTLLPSLPELIFLEGMSWPRIPLPTPYPTAQPGPILVSSLLSPSRNGISLGRGRGRNQGWGCRRRGARGMREGGALRPPQVGGRPFSHTHPRQTAFPSLCIDANGRIRGENRQKLQVVLLPAREYPRTPTKDRDPAAPSMRPW